MTVSSGLTGFAKRWWYLLLAVVCYLPLIFWGYGTDIDTYNVLEAGRTFLESGQYAPSRHPGYLIHEMATTFLALLGGSLLTNLSTVIMSLLTIAGFERICRHYGVPHSGLLIACLIFHPIYLINSTCTIDYVWAIALILWGLIFTTAGRFTLSGIALGLSVGARFSSAIAVAAIIVGFLMFERDRYRGLFKLAIISLLVAIPLYLPSYFSAGRTFNFLSPHLVNETFWSPMLRLGRFGYKNIYFWGVPAFVLLAILITICVRRRRLYLRRPWNGLSLISLLMVVGFEALFFAFPIENEYLLPMLPFVLIMLGIGFSRQKAVLVVFTVALLSYNFININIAKPDVPLAASNASLGLWLQRGLVIEEIETRYRLRHCDDLDCWIEVVEPPVF